MKQPTTPSSLAPDAPAPAPRFGPLTLALFVSGGLLVYLASPVWQPVLVAAVLAATLIGLQERLSRRLWQRRYLAAGVLTVGVVLLILTPLALIATIAIGEAMQALNTVRDVYHEVRTEGFETALHRLPSGIQSVLAPLTDQLPDKLTSLPDGTTEAGRWVAVQLQGAVTTAAGFMLDLTVMLIALFFFLADGQRLVAWTADVSPLGRSRTHELMREFRAISRSLVGSNFLTGAAQAVIATVGYYIASAPQPLFFGLITLVASFLPAVGTALIALPLAGLLLFTGHPWAALFLALWAILVVGVVDNLLRPWLMRGEMHVHGVVVFFAIIGGVGAMGFVGVLVGPLALAFFLTLLRFHARDLHPRHH